MPAKQGLQLRSPRRRSRIAPENDRSKVVLMALRRIIRATDLYSKQFFKVSGLTIPQAVVLQSIHDLGEVTTRQHSERVNLSQGTVTTILDRLESRGLIERYRSAVDRRVVHANLTKQGRSGLRKSRPLLHERFTEAFVALELSEQDRIIETLEKVAEMMGAGHLDAAPLLDVSAPSTDDRTE